MDIISAYIASAVALVSAWAAILQARHAQRQAEESGKQTKILQSQFKRSQLERQRRDRDNLKVRLHKFCTAVENALKVINTAGQYLTPKEDRRLEMCVSNVDSFRRQIETHICEPPDLKVLRNLIEHSQQLRIREDLDGREVTRRLPEKQRREMTELVATVRDEIKAWSKDPGPSDDATTLD